ncbi:MAG: hypothetical protein ETSY1_13115 [Candidatus Entotheonella factor]|uniref:DUF547 domain-containing protein n=1 Tax=Entotheonella factor TaxID=1429438 RepID=W4LPR3_ENTF1|nr:MAG: hypothetical protein ETSY1_13115 [Candidatus Entotheonella factor]
MMLRVLLIAWLVMSPFAWAEAMSIHQRFDQILQSSVVDGAVDYSNIAKNPNFAEYLKELESKPTFHNQPEALVYWINAYNALAIKGILDGRSPRTLLGRYGYFKKAKYRVGGRKISLYDLEHKVIIPMGEPRIHFAINCASQSCPKLLSKAYTTDMLEQQLDTNTRAFINDPSRNRFDRNKKIAYVSKIFDWFQEDFNQHAGSVQKYLSRYVTDPSLAKDLANEQYKIKYLKYDWRLNGTPPRAAQS